VKIAYLTSMYPDVSHTFIMREIRALRARGVDIGTFSVRKPVEHNVLGAAAREAAASTRWLVPPRLSLLLLAVAWVLITRTLRVASVFATAVFKRGLGMRQRLKWLCYFVEAVQLAHYLVSEGFQHLHCHFGNNGSSTGMLAAHLAGIPFSITCHGSELNDVDAHRLVDKVARADFVVCVSHHGRAQLMRKCDHDHWRKLHLVRCGLPANYGAVIPKRRGPARILCIGRLAPEKGHLVLLEALAQLTRQGVSFHCTLVGDGPMRPKVESHIRRLGLTAFVTLVGACAPESVDQFYQQADLVVSASFSEGVPVVLMEALWHECPVVATHVGGVPELIEHRQTGLLVPPGDAGALAAAMCSVLDDPELAAHIGRSGARRVRTEFNLEVSVRHLIDLFHQGRTAEALRDTCTDRSAFASCATRLTIQGS
jgi:colanic acid/amylovoran biosynthesis glycosyltransferase